MSTTDTPTHIIPKVYYDEDDVFTVDVTNNEELTWLYTTEWTCMPISGKWEIVHSREVHKHFCDLVHHFDNPPTVKTASLRSPEPKVILVLRHDTRENAFGMMCKLIDVKDTVVTFLRCVKIPADNINVRVMLKGVNEPAEQQNGGGTCLFESTPDYATRYTSETTWLCKTDAGFKVSDGETSKRHFSELQDAIGAKYRAYLKSIRTGSVKFFVHHETTQDAQEMISKHEEVRAMILECLQAIDSTVKDIQMDVQLQDFIGPVTGKKADSQAWSQMEARRPGPTPKSDVPATPTPARRDARADADLRDACREGNLAEVKRILDTGRADVNCRGGVGRTPVMEAAWRGHGDVVELLVSRGADVSLVDDGGENILHCACLGGDRKTVEFVLSLDGVDVNSRGGRSSTPVMVAARRGHGDVVELLVSRGADVSLVDDDGNNTLHWACWRGDRKTVEFVLSLDRVDINSRGGGSWTPVMWAARWRHRDMVELLVSRGADVSLVDDDGNNTLHWACWRGDRKTVEFVLSLDRVDINSRGGGSWTPVMWAARWRHRDMVELLVSRGADVSLVDDVGDNTLHFACAGGDRKTVEFVLSRDGVDVNVRNNNGQTAADVARGVGHRQLSDLLVSRGTQ
ncbi:serine/threonine-protein phosphatase 6 regulatory ankyrin repeat subunit B-like isoform X2 [Haliotis rubra]|uniref:serine/threonine-protein phosphatase 6 regulatory ankyrin repeat subunit B-like isoform X2 n=1 Tax=Haliotis rubra TaxID=36100 RepID=UPI001EE5799A|nr:serine/threonine-protein phosphatase 6 regulatory ankyrin repeat subunit B-like isoform X2 [Haliotis rubra]